MAQQTHYFIALSLPKRTREILSRWKDLIQESLPFKTWVHPDDYHITLAFLGSASFAQINELKKKITEISLQHSAIDLTLNMIGTFGRTDSPRILWAGLKKNEELFELQKKVYDACTDVGFTLESRPYSPHITIARKWMSEELFDQDTLTSIVHPIDDFTKFQAEHVVLYQSHMNRLPKYQKLSIFPLQTKED